MGQICLIALYTKYEKKHFIAEQQPQKRFYRLLKTGVDIIKITIFGDFCKFSAKKIGVFLDNQFYAQNFAKSIITLSKKRQLFLAIFFVETIF
jgi:hypothetical protein